MSMGSIDLFEKKKLVEVIESFKTIYDIVINPIILSNDIIAARVCENFEELDVIDYKTRSYTINANENYLDYVKGIATSKHELDFKTVSIKLSKLNQAIKNDELDRFINEKFSNLKVVYETLNHHQKNEKSKNKELRESSENQIRLAKEVILKERDNLNAYLVNNKLVETYNKTIDEINQLLKTLENITIETRGDKGKFKLAFKVLFI